MVLPKLDLKRFSDEANSVQLVELEEEATNVVLEFIDPSSCSLFEGRGIENSSLRFGLVEIDPSDMLLRLDRELDTVFDLYDLFFGQVEIGHD